MSINTVSISGNLTRDVENRTTNSGMTIGRFGVAVNERRKNQNGEWEDYANFVDCVLFGRRAEALAQYLTKGMKVAVKGRLHYSSWEDKNGGGKRSKLEVVVDDIDLMSRTDGQGQRKQGYDPAPAAYNDEDIPF